MGKRQRLKLNRVKGKGFNKDSPVEGMSENIDIKKLEDLEDGSTIYEVGKDEEVDFDKGDFDKNLALDMDDEMLLKLSTYILDCLDEDIEARQPWLDIHEKVKKNLGHDVEDLENTPFSQACRLYDTTFSTGLTTFCATVRSEMLPDSGPAGSRVFGKDDGQLEEVGNVRSQWLNYYLTVVDNSFYQDFEKTIHYTGFYGNNIRKVYYDNSLKRPMSRFILPKNFLFDIDCSSILESSRLTHVLNLPAREVLSNQLSGIYRKVELPYLKTPEVTVEDDDDDENNGTSDKKSPLTDLEHYSKRSLHDVYESHMYLSLETFKSNYTDEELKEVAKPYIVTLDKESKEILSIRKSWKDGDENYTRREYFVPYQYLTGFDVWGLGLARLVGTNAIAATVMLRQTVDAASWQNLNSGFYMAGMLKQPETNLTFPAPGEYKPLFTTGSSINEVFMTLPAKEPSAVLVGMADVVRGQIQDQSSSSQLGMMDSKEDIPTGTAIAFLEESNKLQSAVLKSLHASFSVELRLLDEMFKETIEREEFSINGQEYIITKEAYVDSVQIVPVSDPSVNSTMQRVLRAEAALQIGTQFPEIVNLPELIKLVYKAQGIEDSVIETLIIPENKEEEEFKARVDGALQLAAQFPEYFNMSEMLKLALMAQGFEADYIHALILSDEEREASKGEAGDIEQELIRADIEQKREANLIKEKSDAEKIKADTYKTTMSFQSDQLKANAAEELAGAKAQFDKEEDVRKSEFASEQAAIKAAADKENNLAKVELELMKINNRYN